MHRLSTRAQWDGMELNRMEMNGNAMEWVAGIFISNFFGYFFFFFGFKFLNLVWFGFLCLFSCQFHGFILSQWLVNLNNSYSFDGFFFIFYKKLLKRFWVEYIHF